MSEFNVPFSNLDTWIKDLEEKTKHLDDLVDMIGNIRNRVSREYKSYGKLVPPEQRDSKHWNFRVNSVRADENIRNAQMYIHGLITDLNKYNDE